MITKRKPLTLPKLLAKAQCKYYIGIDPGVNTGFARWDKDDKIIVTCTTTTIHYAMLAIYKLHDEGISFFVRVEDARKRKWFGNAGRDQLQGAGSIKRDCKIWEDFLTDLEAPFEMVAPKNNKTKMDAKIFQKITGWKERTNEHARDAAMLVYGL